MALDCDGLLALGPTRLDDIGVDGALRQETGALVAAIAGLEFGSLLFKHVHKQATDDFAFGFGLAHTGELAQEEIAGVHADNPGVQLALEHLHDHVAFVQAQQAMINEHAGELIANGAMNEGRRHRGINPTGEAEDDLMLTHLLANAGHGLGNVIAHHPVGLGLANAQGESLQNGLALNGMRDLGVELKCIEATDLIGHARNRAGLGGGHELEPGRQLGDLVAMAHPDLEHAVAFWCFKIDNAAEECRMPPRTNFCIAELTGLAAFNLPAKLLGHGLHAVTDAQHRHAKLKDRRRRDIGRLFIDARMRT